MDMNNFEFMAKLFEKQNPQLAQIGTAFIEGLREFFDGELEYKEPRFLPKGSTRFAVTIQRERLYVTVRGDISEFAQIVPQHRFRKDRYPGFHVETMKDVKMALTAIRAVKTKAQIKSDKKVKAILKVLNSSSMTPEKLGALLCAAEERLKESKQL